MKPKNEAAVELGKLGRGHPKHYSEAEIARRRKQMEEINAHKRAKKENQQ